MFKYVCSVSFFSLIQSHWANDPQSQTPFVICYFLFFLELCHYFSKNLLYFFPSRMWSSTCCAPAQSTAWRALTLCHPCPSAPAPRVARSTVWQTAPMTVGRWPWCRRESTPSPPIAPSCTSRWSVHVLTRLWVDVLFNSLTPQSLTWISWWPICWRVLGACLGPPQTQACSVKCESGVYLLRDV